MTYYNGDPQVSPIAPIYEAPGGIGGGGRKPARKEPWWKKWREAYNRWIAQVSASWSAWARSATRSAVQSAKSVTPENYIPPTGRP